RNGTCVESFRKPVIFKKMSVWIAAPLSQGQRCLKSPSVPCHSCPGIPALGVLQVVKRFAHALFSSCKALSSARSPAVFCGSRLFYNGFFQYFDPGDVIAFFPGHFLLGRLKFFHILTHLLFL